MKRIRISLQLMILTILLVVMGQIYWLNRLYDQEFDNLKRGIDVQFRNSFFQLQRIRFLKDSTLFNQVLDTVYIEPEKKKKTLPKKNNPKILVSIDGSIFTDSTVPKKLDDIKPENIRSIRVINSKRQTLPPEFFESIILKSGNNKNSDSFPKSKPIVVEGINISLVKDTVPVKEPILVGMPLKENPAPQKNNINRSGNPIIQVISNNKTLNDSIPVEEVKKSFQRILNPNQKELSYFIIRERWKRTEFPQLDQTKDTLKGFITSPQLSGIQKIFSYQVLFPDVHFFVLKQMSGQIIGSLIMIVMLITAFLFIYYTLHRQKRLADMKNEFISNITHELKTPIATVHVALEALHNFKAIDDPQKTKEYLDISISELNRLELLVDNVLKRSMIEKDAILLEQSIVDLQKIIQHVLLNLKIQFEKTSAKITFDINGEDFKLKGDELHLSALLHNLLDNAIKYSNKKPEINIKLKKDIKSIFISIEDNGIGIPKEYQGKVFQPFFRVPNMDRHNVKGYGLGLSYVAQIIKLHGGAISVSESPQKGTIFNIELPIA